MKYEELINELCEVIKESENNAELIYQDTEEIEKILANLNVDVYDKNKIKSRISNILGLLQHQDLHRQKIERVVNFVCEKNNIDKSRFNIAPSAKNIDSNEVLGEQELEALIKEMQKS